MTAELARTLVLIGLATCGVFLIILSFMPWVEFSTIANPTIPELTSDAAFSLTGADVSRIRGAVTLNEAANQGADACTCRNDFGDGYLAAILGGVTIVAGGAAFLLRRAARSLAAVGILASLGAFSIAGYNAIAIWQGIGRTEPDELFVNLDGAVQPALYALTAVAGLAAILGGGVFATMARGAPEMPQGTDDKMDMDDFDEDALQLEEVNESWV